MNKIPLLLGMFLGLSWGRPLWAQPQTTNTPPIKKITVQEYIEMYKDIAIREMERSGIPASVTLSQGIHESSAGNSSLAREANNHFGIKCGKNWTGKTFYKWDDEEVESCFRVYENADESYAKHSDFLMQGKRYAFLFDYDRTDYINWAQGLKKAGYATDPQYPQKLIGTIQNHKLDRFDLALSPIYATGKTEKDSITGQRPLVPEVYVLPPSLQRKLRNKPRSFLFKSYKKGLFIQNGTTYAVAQRDETSLEIATRFDIPYRKFLRFNDLVDGDQLISYQYAYIGPKKSTYKGTEDYHRIEQDETMYELAQYYGIRLSSLLERNLLAEGEEPKRGEIILLKEKALSKPALRPANHKDLLPAPNSESPVFVKVETPVKTELPKVDTVKTSPTHVSSPTYPEKVYDPYSNYNTAKEDKNAGNLIDPNKEVQGVSFEDFLKESPSPIVEMPIDSPKQTTIPNKEENKVEKSTTIIRPNPFENKAPVPSIPTNKETNVNYILHTVQPSETLYRVGLKYGISWQEIQKFNQLPSPAIKENQILKIPKTN